MLKDFVFGPGIYPIKDDAFLAGCDKIFDFGNDLADNPVGALGLANHFAEGFFVVWCDRNIAFLHFFENHATEVNFGIALIGKMVDSDGFTATAHADEGNNFNVFVIF